MTEISYLAMLVMTLAALVFVLFLVYHLGVVLTQRDKYRTTIWQMLEAAVRFGEAMAEQEMGDDERRLAGQAYVAITVDLLSVIHEWEIAKGIDKANAHPQLDRAVAFRRQRDNAEMN